MQHGQMNIAVVGGGIAGIIAAWLLSRKHRVTLFEKNNYLGGHTNTVAIPAGPDAGTAIDTGFIVLNTRNYQNFHKFLAELAVPVRFADMSFSYYNTASGFCYGSRNLNMIFAQRKNILNPEFLRMLFEFKKFWSAGRAALENTAELRSTLGSFLAAHRFSKKFCEEYVIPISAAIWSSPAQGILDFPVETFLRFFDQHGLLSYYDQPRWQTVVGGSREYVKAFEKAFKGRILLNTSICSVQREPQAIFLRDAAGVRERFDHLVLATHADQALRLLEDADKVEKELLSPWSYQRNFTVLHSDINVLPPTKRAWAGWNYRREKEEGREAPIAVSYYMNALQGLKTKEQYCVTLNPRGKLKPERIVKEIEYHHPVYSEAAVRTQARLKELSSRRRTSFCGSYFGFGFHEDAVKSGILVAEALGIRW